MDPPPRRSTRATRASARAKATASPLQALDMQARKKPVAAKPKKKVAQTKEVETTRPQSQSPKKRTADAEPAEEPIAKRQNVNQQRAESSTRETESERYSTERETTPEPEPESEKPQQSHTVASTESQIALNTPKARKDSAKAVPIIDSNTDQATPKAITPRPARRGNKGKESQRDDNISQTAKDANSKADSTGDAQDTIASKDVEEPERKKLLSIKHVALSKRKHTAKPSADLYLNGYQTEFNGRRSTSPDSPPVTPSSLSPALPDSHPSLLPDIVVHSPSGSAIPITQNDLACPEGSEQLPENTPTRPNNKSPCTTECSSEDAANVPTPIEVKEIFRPYNAWTFTDNIISHTFGSFELTNSSFADLMLDMATYAKDNPNARAPPTKALFDFLKGWGTHEDNEATESPAPEPSTPATPSSNADVDDTAAEPATPATQPRRWRDILDPRNLTPFLARPLNIFGSGRRAQPATEGRVRQRPQASTPTRRELNRPAPSTVAMAPKVPRAQTNAKENRPLFGSELRRPDFDLPAAYRGTPYRDLPWELQVKSKDLYDFEKQESEKKARTERLRDGIDSAYKEKRSSAMKSIRNGNYDDFTTPSKGSKAYHDRPIQYGPTNVRAQPEDDDTEDRKEALDTFLKAHPNLKLADQATGGKRKRTMTIKYVVKKDYQSKTASGGFALPTSIFRDDSDDEAEISVEVEDISDNEANGEADEEAIYNTPSNKRRLDRMKLVQEDSAAQSSSSKHFAVPEHSSDEDNDGRQRNSKRQRTDSKTSGAAEDASDQGIPDSVWDDFSMINDEPEWDISEKDPLMRQAYTFKLAGTHKWICDLAEINFSGENLEAIAKRQAEYKVWWKNKCRYEKKWNDVAKKELIRLGLDGWNDEKLGPWGCVELKAKKFKEYKFPTPVPKTWEERHPFSLLPPKPQFVYVPPVAIVEEYPTEDDNTSSRSGRDRSATPDDEDNLEPEGWMIEATGPFGSRGYGSLSEQRRKANIFMSKTPSNLSHMKNMSPLQPKDSNIMTSKAAAEMAYISTDPEVIEAAMSIPDEVFECRFIMREEKGMEKENEVSRAANQAFDDLEEEL